MCCDALGVVLGVLWCGCWVIVVLSRQGIDGHCFVVLFSLFFVE
ncbi:hypothetical protein CpCAPGE03_2136 [Corynebacterium pseudotuberculosis]|nr:Hypothetical protein Cp3995_0596 [Corynebacterium pseudotuberculosis 3/99-5]AFH51900.1 Hypothetical protein Cp267_1000 [Corynebacterium pseudotuberculosis 267]AIG05900.1 hypothetical protein CPTA_00071 [Corynebacterium pseudotuberculosis]AEX39441.1 Hypothetical protein Cp3995_0977 [Corynebacterium pseudotuberculosis 3/99-5]AEX40194.1 Hypothetical protein Cp3995_1741 [Corynebacterium pseudotuberculosis 3/99-5]